MITVNDIQGDVAATCDQNPDVTAIDSADYALRLNYLNGREREWSETGKWQCLVKEYNTLTSTVSGNCSISLPSDYRSMAILPKLTFDGVNTLDFQDIRPQDESKFDQSTSAYGKIMGNPASGYTMVVNPPNGSHQLASGASIKILYYSTPASLVSPNDVVTCPNPNYLVEGVIADVWESKEDPRYREAGADANLLLQNMIEFENTPAEQSYGAEVHTIEQRSNFRWGR
jgi:hypothetical protein